jgi:hypothetical protein
LTICNQKFIVAAFCNGIGDLQFMAARHKQETSRSKTKRVSKGAVPGKVKLGRTPSFGSVSVITGEGLLDLGKQKIDSGGQTILFSERQMSEVKAQLSRYMTQGPRAMKVRFDAEVQVVGTLGRGARNIHRKRVPKSIYRVSGSFKIEPLNVAPMDNEKFVRRGGIVAPNVQAPPAIGIEPKNDIPMFFMGSDGLTDYPAISPSSTKEVEQEAFSGVEKVLLDQINTRFNDFLTRSREIDATISENMKFLDELKAGEVNE